MPKYGTHITDMRKAARRNLMETASALGVSRHVLRQVELGSSPPFARPFHSRLMAFLAAAPDQLAQVERAWRAEEVVNMTPRNIIGSGAPAPVAPPAPQTRGQAIAAVEAQVLRARQAGQAVRESGRRISQPVRTSAASSCESQASFSGPVGEVRARLLLLLRRQDPSRRVAVTVVLGSL